MFPSGIGLVYYAAILTGMEWFPENKGAITGFIAAGYGFGAFIFGPLCQLIVNPENSKPFRPDDGTGTQDELFGADVAARVPRMLRLCLIPWCVLCVMAVALAKRAPPKPESPYIAQAIERPFEVRESVRTTRFLQMGTMFLAGPVFGFYVASVYKTSNQGMLSDSILTVAGSLGAICNGSSRIIWGGLQDKYGFRKVYTTLMLLQWVISFTLHYTRASGFLYTLWVCCSFFCLGGHFSLFPSAIVRIFGITNGGMVSTIAALVCVPTASLAGYALA